MYQLTIRESHQCNTEIETRLPYCVHNLEYHKDTHHHAISVVNLLENRAKSNHLCSVESWYRVVQREDQRGFEFIGIQRAILVRVEFQEDISVCVNLVNINILFEVGLIHSNVRVVRLFGQIEDGKLLLVELNLAVH